jgi:hypothetical protein
VRSFPFVPRSTAQLEVGDFWTVPLSHGDVGILQVRDLKRSGTASRSAFIAGVVDWRGIRTPAPADLRGCRVLVQGLVRIEVFTEGGAQIVGNAADTAAVDRLTSAFRDHSVGTITYTWGWKMLPRRVEQTLTEATK